MAYYSTPPRSDELYHYGIKGMKWGVRRYQNEDGSLTEAGKRRYEDLDLRNMSRIDKIKNRKHILELRSKYPLAKPDDLLRAEALNNERTKLAKRNAIYAQKKWGKQLEKIEDVKDFLRNKSLDDKTWARMNREIAEIEDDYYRTIGWRK